MSTIAMAIAGWPVAHSLSPRLWEGVGARRGIRIEYGLYPVAPDDEDAWAALWSSDLSAFNVTAPLKERAAGSATTLAPLSRRIGAVNFVMRRGDGWLGASTDGYGFVRSILAREEPLRNRSVAVLGTGGAGRAVARAAADAGARPTFVTRDPARVPPGCEDLPRLGWVDLVDAGPFDIIVNGTPLGRGIGATAAPEIPYQTWCRGALAVDLNYSPPVTAFLRNAHAHGARTLNGLGMLIHQACMGAALLLDDDPAAAEEYEGDFWAAAREIAPQAV